MREHTEFIHHETLPWETLTIPGFPEKSKQKILSIDHETKAFTSLVHIPAGSTGEGGIYQADLELLILKGKLRIGTTEIVQLTHLYLESGTRLAPIVVQSDLQVLLMSAGDLITRTIIDSEKEMIIQDTNQMAWEATITPGFTIGAMRKSLFQHPKSGASSWLLGVLPQMRDTRYEIHPVVEEGFQIYGEMTTDRGLFHEGSYFWRPPGIPHGDFETQRGCLTFFRTDGPLKTTYVIKPEQGE
ncbi:protein of unknown function [Seinonella peptonophila]|uniref:ChrR Cupin-like domain-containing protein n=1 Tax=Seinonella peptonophila TaxID=112248 RepID=A0A1M5AE55_9BACL|nr:DUF4437 domain-containing protein [Seinonella peptonophila]SHF28407.1 protein of unknown function [Seinonella peptonophila]